MNWKEYVLKAVDNKAFGFGWVFLGRMLIVIPLYLLPLQMFGKAFCLSFQLTDIWLLIFFSILITKQYV